MNRLVNCPVKDGPPAGGLIGRNTGWPGEPPMTSIVGEPPGEGRPGRPAGGLIGRNTGRPGEPPGEPPTTSIVGDWRSSLVSHGCQWLPGEPPGEPPAGGPAGGLIGRPAGYPSPSGSIGGRSNASRQVN